MHCGISEKTRPRLAKLLLMLSSPRDGEVLNAARLITHTLKNSGADWHDLTAGLLAAPVKTETGSSDGDGDAGDWRVTRGFCLKYKNRLSARELDFVNSLGRWRGSLTPKQSDWLEAIYERITD
jgi:hypothetical protein